MQIKGSCGIIYSKKCCENGVWFGECIMERKLKQSGYVVFSEGRYKFKSNRGEEFEIIQDSKAKDLFESGELCEFEQIPTKSANERLGRIINVHGNGDNVMVQLRAIASRYGLSNTMSSGVKSEVAKIPNTVRPADKKNYVDLTHVPFVTIDPDTAKDYDDAVYAQKNDDGSYTLKVAIANVAAYVPYYSQLFAQAIEKGNTTYLENLVFPMFHEKISNGICSINEGVERLAMCTTCTINPDGSLRNYKVEPAVIKSAHRLKYKEADYIHFGTKPAGNDVDIAGLLVRTAHVRDGLGALYDVAEILYNARMKRGAFDIENKELEFEYSEDSSQVVDVRVGHNEKYTSVIEETAVLTNEIWGEIAGYFDIPFVYRNHEIINDDKITRELQAKLKPFNLTVPNYFGCRDIQKVINSVKGKRISDYVVSVLLSAMKPATYSAENKGHVGLAIHAKSNKHEANIDSKARVEDARTKYFKETGSPYGFAFDGDISHSAYAHTTSDIRRGADLINQTQMQALIFENDTVFTNHDIDEYALSLNYNEKLAKMAEADCNDMLLALLAKNNIGAIFNNCYITDLCADHAVIMTDKGIKMNMSYKALDFSKRYLKIGKEIKSVTISSVSLAPPRINCVPTPIMETRKQQESALESK